MWQTFAPSTLVSRPWRKGSARVSQIWLVSNKFPHGFVSRFFCFGSSSHASNSHGIRILGGEYQPAAPRKDHVEDHVRISQQQSTNATRNLV